MAPLLNREEEEFEAGLSITPDVIFVRCGAINRSNYKRQWVGAEYYIKCGKFKGSYLSQVDSEKWLLWALNQFEGQLEFSLYRALVDQLNSLHK